MKFHALKKNCSCNNHSVAWMVVRHAVVSRCCSRGYVRNKTNKNACETVLQTRCVCSINDGRASDRRVCLCRFMSRGRSRETWSRSAETCVHSDSGGDSGGGGGLRRRSLFTTERLDLILANLRRSTSTQCKDVTYSRGACQQQQQQQHGAGEHVMRVISLTAEHRRIQACSAEHGSHKRECRSAALYVLARGGLFVACCDNLIVHFVQHKL